MNQTETSKIITTLKAYWPAVKFEDNSTELWCDALNDVTYGQAMLAVRELVKEEKFCPTIAHIREKIFGPPMSPGQIAWDRFSSGGRIAPDGSRDPLLEQALGIIGGEWEWSRVELSKKHFLEKKFIEEYDRRYQKKKNEERLYAMASFQTKELEG